MHGETRACLLTLYKHTAPAAASSCFCAATCLCSSANGMQQKLYNWNTLNSKVLKRLGLQLTKQHMQEIALCTPGAIEQALQVVKLKIANYQEPR
jgi:hypothetical protein